jgi:hypothetical protein
MTLLKERPLSELPLNLTLLKKPINKTSLTI